MSLSRDEMLARAKALSCMDQNWALLVDRLGQQDVKIVEWLMASTASGADLSVLLRAMQTQPEMLRAVATLAHVALQEAYIRMLDKERGISE